MTQDQRLIPPASWLVVVIAAWCALTGVTLFSPGTVPAAAAFTLPILLIVVFSALHAARHYGWRGAGQFFLIGIVVSFLYEATSVRTGFPFGFYRHADWINPKFLLIPWYIGLLYPGLTYLGWRMAIALLGTTPGERSSIALFGLPLVASFITVGWDICFDPIATTFGGFATYRGGGGYFGVPLSNYVGWFLTCWTLCQCFALIRRRAAPDGICGTRTDRFAPSLFWALFSLQVFLICLTTPGSSEVSDQGGRVWHMADLLDTMTIMAAYSLLFAAVASALAIARRAAGALSSNGK